MNAKELREAAEFELKRAQSAKADVEKRNPGSILPSLEAKIAIYEHILATVREDDDEPIDEAWFNTMSENADGTIVIDDGLQFYWDGAELMLWNYSNGFRIGRVETRGQFRRLCEGLGIQMKEKA